MSAQREEELMSDLPVFEPEPENADQLNLQSADTRSELAIKVLKQIHESIGHVIDMLDGESGEIDANQLAHLITSKKQLAKELEDTSGVRVLEGVFNGDGMVGSDGKAYIVPANYASKSRLVAGDVLKLTIKPNGIFIFKQIGPIERKRIVGCLALDERTNEFVVVCEDVPYKVLTASVTYFKGEPGDDVVAFVPKSGKCSWAAVENIIKK